MTRWLQILCAVLACTLLLTGVAVYLLYSNIVTVHEIWFEQHQTYALRVERVPGRFAFEGRIVDMDASLDLPSSDLPGAPTWRQKIGNPPTLQGFASVNHELFISTPHSSTIPAHPWRLVGPGPGRLDYRCQLLWQRPF